MAISESIVDSSTEAAAAAAACDGVAVVSACISSREGTYRCNDDVFVIPCCFRTGVIIVVGIFGSILVETTGGEVLLGVVNDVT